eukprot:CAMPEP_0196767722 /NCGR_PEP_ID=MMETSP1095-20130614/41897_1 /TAXON_ID=96789 ORGANISM="Chromulina nebulosa, Strain UTEXLB2642" /NCGR_SAMPLE_ID=MMETSP1095 /ASSEMBLY_ACC=CAM_ASM_000446 /LENGTH=272 /DNA_ID=CAMNT_0042136311 /DNA_START=638 /DNA_END=1456 /DNA_ORIENTATION=+
MYIRIIWSDYLSDVMGNYCALNVMLDEAITNLTCTLESYGMADNTVLVIVSDNGGEVTVPGNNYPFRGAKGSYTRGGVSVNGLIHSKYIPDSMKGQSYEGQVHVTDWLPTLMGLATNGEWTGSYSGADIDGVDMWDAIMTNSDSPHEEIVHYANGDSVISIQYNMNKLDRNVVEPDVATPVYIFSEDKSSSSSNYLCENPSLIYDTKSSYKVFNYMTLSGDSFIGKLSGFMTYVVLGVVLYGVVFYIQNVKKDSKSIEMEGRVISNEKSTLL